MYPITLPKTIVEPIEQVFPSADSRRLFQHVRAKTSSLILASGLRNDQDKNPYMSMVLRLMLLDVDSPAQIGFRHSLLSLGAAHVLHQIRHQETSALQAQNMRVRTVKSKRKALGYLHISATKDGSQHADLLLATCLTLFIRNVSDCFEAAQLMRVEPFRRSGMAGKHRFRSPLDQSLWRAIIPTISGTNEPGSEVLDRADCHRRPIQ